MTLRRVIIKEKMQPFGINFNNPEYSYEYWLMADEPEYFIVLSKRKDCIGVNEHCFDKPGMSWEFAGKSTLPAVKEVERWELWIDGEYNGTFATEREARTSASFCYSTNTEIRRVLVRKADL